MHAARQVARDAFEAVIGPLIEPAHRFATGMLRDSHAAEDAVQEAAVRAWQKLDRLRPGSPVQPWFLAIVANQCNETFRSHWRTVLPLPGGGSIASTEEETDRHIDVINALADCDIVIG